MKLCGVDPLISEYQKLYPLNPKIEWRDGYLEQLPFENESFPLVFCSNAIDHVENLDSAQREIRRVLRNDGSFILTVDVFADSLPPRNEGHPHSFTIHSIQKHASDHGFRVAFERLARRKIGMMRYAKRRLRNRKSRKQIYQIASTIELGRSLLKHIARRGSIGEYVMILKKDI
jgi:2-polyprenyl-6-hydroxyphenyl methylase/3-demethylubiquinone-9 3-methyltransferase